MTRSTRLFLAALAGAFAVIAMLSAQNRRLHGSHVRLASEYAALKVVSEASAQRFDSVNAAARALADTASQQARTLARVRADAARLASTLLATARTAESLARDTTVARETLAQTILAMSQGIREREAAQQVADSVSGERIAALQASILAQAAASALALSDAERAWKAKESALIAAHRASTPTRMQRVARATMWAGGGYLVGRLAP